MTDRSEIRRIYSRLARSYEPWARMAAPFRRRLISQLRLSPGDAVIDVGCGTGTSFPALVKAVGPSGRIVGFDLTREMLDHARARVARAGWKNVQLIEGAADDVDLPQCDAAMFCLVPWVLQDPIALQHVLDNVRPGGRVAALAEKMPPRWSIGARAWVKLVSPRFGVGPEDIDRPWRCLAELVPTLEVKSMGLGAFFVASGSK